MQNFIQNKNILPVISNLKNTPNVYRLFKSLYYIKGLNFTNLKPLLHNTKLSYKIKTTIQIYSEKQLQNYKHTNIFFPLFVYDNYMYTHKPILTSKNTYKPHKFTNNSI